MVNKPLIRPYFLGGYVRGGWLISHDPRCLKTEVSEYNMALKFDHSLPNPWPPLE